MLVYKNYELEIAVDSFSAVDSFIVSGYDTETDRMLTDEELNQLQDLLGDEIFEYSMMRGSRYTD